MACGRAPRGVLKFAAMQADEFIRKWSPGGQAHALGERAGAQAHFIDLCRVLGVPEPADPDRYCFERGPAKTASAASGHVRQSRRVSGGGVAGPSSEDQARAKEGSAMKAGSAWRRCITGATLAGGFVASLAAPLGDLGGGQTGRIEFDSRTPEHRWALIRGRLGPEVTIFGDLLMPSGRIDGQVPAVIFSHGSEGVSNLCFDVWAKVLNAAGYAVFVVDSFKPRGEDRVTGPSRQLTWNTVANTTDALFALKLLATHPQIDRRRIFHMGWSRGGQALLDAAWPTFQQHVLPIHVKWAGGVAIYPGCNMRYRVDHHGRLPAPILMLLGERDEMTLPKPCMELADEYAAAGHPVSYKVYAGATHVFDRLGMPWRKVNEGSYNGCSMDVRMPYGADDRRWGPAHDKYSGETFTDPNAWGIFLAKCKQTSWVAIESNAGAREQAVRDVLDFLKTASQAAR